MKDAPPAVWIGAIAALGVVVLVGVAWIARRLVRRKQPAPVVAGAPGPAMLPSPGPDGELGTKAMAQLAANEASRAKAEEEMLASLQLPPSTKKTEVLRKQIGDSAKRDPQATAQLIRSWLNEQER